VSTNQKTHAKPKPPTPPPRRFDHQTPIAISPAAKKKKKKKKTPSDPKTGNRPPKKKARPGQKIKTENPENPQPAPASGDKPKHYKNNPKHWF
jgi:hypothetical protein